VMMINSTFGTTCEGILEDLSRFQEIIKREKIWLHIDACVTGIALFSNKYIIIIFGYDCFNLFSMFIVLSNLFVYNHQEIIKLI